MKSIWIFTQTCFAAIGVVLGWYLGGVDGFIYALIAFVVADYIMGVLRAITEKRLSSRIGAEGISKKVAIFIVIGIGNLVDLYLLDGKAAPLRTAVIFFYCANEGISVLENAAAIGLPVPEKLKDVLVQLHDKV